MKKLLQTVLMVLVAGVSTLSAATYKVGNAQELSAIKANAGDTVVLAKGQWEDQKLMFSARGESDRPVVLQAEMAGQTIFKGKSSLSISGQYIVVDGLYFENVTPETGAVISFRVSSSKLANNSIVRNCAITGKGQQPDMTDYKWVSIYGKDNTVENCSFIDKKNMGTLLVVWLEDGQKAGHTIRSNYFSRPYSLKDDQGKSVNGQETLRIGTSAVSMTNAECIVEGNYFYRCNGEIECISNKSCENIYRTNTFTECAGTLTLRHGDRCEVYGNIFYGNEAENTGGIRLIGEDHKVYNNYLQDLAGSGFSSAICLVQGQANPELSGYFKAKNCFVVNNTIVNCKTGIALNYGSTRTTEPVQDNTIAANVIVNYKDNKSIMILERTTPARARGTVWRDNIVHGGRFRDTDASSTGSEEVDPDLRRYKDLYVPMQKTGLTKMTVKGFDFVTTDLLGTERDVNNTLPGAFNAVKKLDYKPASSSNTGVNWKLK